MPSPDSRISRIKSIIRGSGLSEYQVFPVSDQDRASDKLTDCVQWTSSDNKNFIPTSRTVERLPPGTYDIGMNQANGLFFEKVPVLENDLVVFPESNTEKIVGEIRRFWDREEIYRRHRLAFKRGILLYGPPGSGKSCTIQLVMNDVVQRNGIVINFCEADLFVAGARKLREIQPDTPVVVLMEDVDSILQDNEESSVLNVLDGVNQIDKVVFLATTNYPERLGERVINRPSRFDKRFKIGYPDERTRRIYFERIIGDKLIGDLKIDLDLWVRKTDEFSMAHLKELFVAVAVLGDDFDEAVETLISMKEDGISSRDDAKKMGF
jgi:SpoVK/Ycf46/Vps4 family AAA+-type ATPase